MQRKGKKPFSSPVLISLPDEEAQPVPMDYKNIKISKPISEQPPNLETDIEIHKKRPSAELINSIENFGNFCKDLKKLNREIREKGSKEGFSDLEIILLARKILRKRLSNRQLNYWFPLKQYWKKKKEIEDSSNRNSQFVNNDDKKGIEESTLSLESSSVDIVPILGTQICSVAERTDFVGQSRETNRRAISYFDLADPTFINCTGHPMYQKAKETIQQLERLLDEKNHFIDQLKGNKGLENETVGKVYSKSTEIAATDKTDNHQEVWCVGSLHT
jgi:hypothetical protein